MNKYAKRSLLVLASLTLVAGIFTGCKKKKAPASSLSSAITSSLVSQNQSSSNQELVASSSISSLETSSEEQGFTITYNNGGHGNEVNSDKSLALPSTLPTLSEEEYIFLGWYSDAEFKTKAVAGSSITSDTTLYAKWIKDTGIVSRTFDVTTIAKANSWVSQTRYTTLPIDDTSLSITVEGGGNTGKGYLDKTNNSWDWRMYQANAGATITISCVGLIKSIMVTFTNTNSGELHYQDTIMESGASYIINDSSCQLIVGGPAGNGQIRISSITIDYVEGESSEESKLSNLLYTVEGAIKTLSSYSTITKKNLDNAEIALDNATTAVDSYVNAGGTLNDIPSYNTYQSIKNSITLFKQTRSYYKQQADKNINLMDEYLSNESITSESTLTDEQYLTLKKYYTEAVTNSTYYVVNYGTGTDLVSTESYALVDKLLEAYYNAQYDLGETSKISKEYTFNFESVQTYHMKEFSSNPSTVNISSGMFKREMPYVSMNFTSAFKSSTYGDNKKPVISKGKITIDAKDSLISSFKLTLGKVTSYDKVAKIYYYDINDELVKCGEMLSFNGASTYEINVDSLPNNVHKIVIDLSEDSNLVYANKLVLKLINDKQEDVISNYYASIDSTYFGETLYSALETLTTTTHTYKTTYDDCSYLAYLTDYSENNPGQIIDFYSKKVIDGSWDSTKWNREHVYCQSRGWYGDLNTPNAGTDLHHVRPLIQNINSSRNNSQYGELDNRDDYKKYYNDTLWGYLNGNIGISSVNSRGETITDGVYEPLDSVKGDVARILMYLLTRYRDIMINPNGTNVDKDNNPIYYPITNNVYTKEGTVEAAYALLLKWNESDPVDQDEINRNEAVYTIQGNRNPFIDHPEYANLIWKS